MESAKGKRSHSLSLSLILTLLRIIHYLISLIHYSSPPPSFRSFIIHPPFFVVFHEVRVRVNDPRGGNSRQPPFPPRRCLSTIALMIFFCFLSLKKILGPRAISIVHRPV